MIPIPAIAWKIGGMLALIGAAVAIDAYRVRQADQAGFNRATSERAARDGLAILRRTDENIVIADKQATINTIITKVKNEELAPVVQRIYVDRVRVGPGICPAAATSDTKGPASGNGSTPGSRLVSQRTEEDIRELEAKVETYLATGRACQAFVRENGMVP